LDAQRKEEDMELLDRYLEAVRKHLPGDRQDDIIAELRANLESQLEEKEGELGRALTAEEARGWLKELGPPMLMAARYHEPRYLIGPALFPTYWWVLKLSAGLALVMYGVVSGVLLALSKAGMDELAGAVLRLPGVLMVTATCVTVVFAALEYVARQYPEKCPAIVASSVNWSPATLPPVEKRGAGDGTRRGLAGAVAEVVFGALWLAWLLLLPQHPYLLMGPGIQFFYGHGIVAGPALLQFYWWVVGMTLVQLAWHALDLALGTWRRPRGVRRAVANALGLIPLAVLLAGSHAFLALQDSAAGYGAGLEQANRWIYFGAIVITTIVGIQLVVDIGRMGMEARRKREARRSGLAG
jgi:hypothetical protein